MKFNFDELTERRGTASYKWDSDAGRDMIPLWVADMDFKTAPCIVEALRQRVEQGIFGYVKVPGSYYEALDNWFESRHGWTIDPDTVIYTSGVVPAISAIIKALVKPGEGVIVHTPAYNCFFSSIRNNGCEVVANPLFRKETEEGFTYKIDFDGLERLAAKEENRMLILCNPHNPTGRVWTREELERIRDICRKNGVIVVSDEIHCELTHPGYKYTPYLTVDPTAIGCCSPSKAFNLAGLQIANIVAPNAEQRKRIDKAININEVCDVNPFGVIALQEAYRHGGEWLEELNAYLYSNYEFLRDFLRKRMPMLRKCCSESTYLAWIDIRSLGLTADEVEEIGKNHGVWVNAGTLYGGQGYIRINYACPRERLKEGLERFTRGF
ncbi:MAG: pyridoxal phosphate-dependent aminotransferase [Muribaculaceae bacterium]|nr:pyridoxal phosphate-dependent aminotransferase [Muribaculaceae bacterium]